MDNSKHLELKINPGGILYVRLYLGLKVEHELNNYLQKKIFAYTVFQKTFSNAKFYIKM